jgi:hypothetical protein
VSRKFRDEFLLSHAYEREFTYGKIRCI